MSTAVSESVRPHGLRRVTVLLLTFAFAVATGCGSGAGDSVEDLGAVSVWEHDEFIGALAVGPDGTLFTHSFFEGEVWSIDPETGQRGWTIDREDVSGTPVVGDDGTVYLRYDDTRVVALDGDDGSELWVSEPASRDIDTNLALADNGALLAGTETSDGRSRLYAFDTEAEGQVRWHFEVEGGSENPVVGEDDMVYFAAGNPSMTGEDDYQLYAVDGDGGGESAEWTFDEGGEISVNPLPGEDDAVYVKQGDELYEVDGQTGQQRWEKTIGEGFHKHTGMVLGEDGTIYIGLGDSAYQYLWALDGDSGQEVWRFEIPEVTVHLFSPAVADDGTVFVGGTDGTFYGVESEDGTVAWDLDFSVDMRVKLIGEDGTLYTGGPSGQAPGTLHALEHDSMSGPADSPWPMFRQGPQRTAALD